MNLLDENNKLKRELTTYKHDNTNYEKNSKSNFIKFLKNFMLIIL